MAVPGSAVGSLGGWPQRARCEALAQLFVSAGCEFSSDFPFALRADVSDRGQVPGAIEALLHVRPDRFVASVLFAVVETALVVLRACRVELVFPAPLRRLIVSEVYQRYGALVRHRVSSVSIFDLVRA